MRSARWPSAVRRTLTPAAWREAASDEGDGRAAIEARANRHRVGIRMSAAATIFRDPGSKLSHSRAYRLANFFDLTDAIEMTWRDHHREIPESLAQFTIRVDEHQLFAGSRRALR